MISSSELYSRAVRAFLAEKRNTDPTRSETLRALAAGASDAAYFSARAGLLG